MNVSAVSDGGSANGVSKRVCGTNAPFVASMESSSGDQPKEHRVMEQPVQPVQDAGPYGPTGPWTDYRASGARVFGPTGPLDRFAGSLRPALVARRVSRVGLGLASARARARGGFELPRNVASVGNRAAAPALLDWKDIYSISNIKWE